MQYQQTLGELLSLTALIELLNLFLLYKLRQRINWIIFTMVLEIFLFSILQYIIDVLNSYSE